MKVRLGEACEFIRGVTFDRSVVRARAHQGHIPILRAGNISDRLETANDLIWVPRGLVASRQLLRKNDVVICMSSGSSEVVGKTASVEADAYMAVGSFCGTIRPRRIDQASYISYFFRSAKFREHRDSIARGANIQNLRFSEFEDIEIEIPQDASRIANILDQADRLRRLRRQSLALSDTFLPAVFRQMFGDEETVALVEDLLADRPNAIRTGPFGSQLLHSEFTPNGGVAVLGIDNAVDNRFEWAERRFITLTKYEKLRRYTVQPGDVLITLMGTTGRCAVVPEGIPLSINTKHLCCITLDWNRCLPVYLHGAFLFHPNVRRQLHDAQKGAIMEGLNMEIIKNLSIPVPLRLRQEKYSEIVDKHERLRTNLREALRQADHLFQSLLHRAFADGL